MTTLCLLPILLCLANIAYTWDDFNYYDHYPDFYRPFRRYDSPEDDLFDRPCQCIKLKHCQSFIDILSKTSTREISPFLAQKFRKASCGFRNAEPVVCCPTPASRFGRNNRKREHTSTTTEETWVWDVEKEESDTSEEGFGGWHRPHNRFDPNNFHHDHHYDYDWKPNRRRHHYYPHFEDPHTKKNCPPGFSKEFDLPNTVTPVAPSLDSPGSAETTTSNKQSLVNSDLCGISVNTRIIGGEDAGPGQFPWMARLAYRNLSE
ncbi:uncharacterized protein LOC132258448 [Phlebotomus argentipes]|uniref:uncharacterized protein LOC132258448 n=1 Tax=Phlebotomus argentipes TaxID=94469 RepID=UPI0028929D59|nr:uncharacterized protein LOC132258448 [Phlebotomus argentipes]